MKKKIFIFLIFLFLISEIHALNGADFAIYKGSGTWEPSITAFKNFLKWKNLTWEEVSAWDINNRDLRTLYKGIFFPGGWAYDYKKSIRSSGNQNIRNLVSSGGAYIGMSAGAYYACDNVRWEGKDYPYYLNLFHGDCIGPIEEIAPWPDYVMTTMLINKDHPANLYEALTEDVLYYGEPYFVPYQGQEMQVFARWIVPENPYVDNSPGIIGFNYGEGRVLLVGPHPEIEEDSSRDGTNFGDELDDNGSDWPFLWTAVDWLLKKNISQPPELSGGMRDTTNPAINSVLDFPDPVFLGEVLRFRANVTDDRKVSSVWLEILDNNYTMALEFIPGEGLFYDSFESGNLNGWITKSVSGGKNWTVSSGNAFQGTYSAISVPMSTSEPASVLERSISTVGKQNITFSYYRKLLGLDAADEFKVKWFDGVNWNVLEETGKNSANNANYIFKSFSLPSSANNNPNFRIRFECTAGAISESCQIDNVNVSSGSSTTEFYKYEFNTTGFAPGVYQYFVYANDSAGNQAISVGDFSII